MREATKHYKPKRRVEGKRTSYQSRYRSPITGEWTMAKPAWNYGSATFKLQKDAQRAIDEAVSAELQAAAAPDAPRTITVADYFERWLVDHPRRRRTQMGYNSKIRVAMLAELEGVALGEWEMRALRRRHGREFVGHSFSVRERNANGTRAVLRALGTFFEDAIEDEYCEVNPFRSLGVSDDDARIVKPSREPRVWSFDELHDFASFAGVWEPLYLVMIDCGARLGESLALQRSLCRPDRIKIEGTASEGRVVPSSSRKNHDRFVVTSERLESLLRARATRIDTPWLFPTATGKLWRENNWREDVHKPTIEAANRGRTGKRLDPRPHEMRHSWVTNLRAAGIDPADLADMAGHGIEVATKVYTHALSQSDAAVRAVVST